MPGPLCRCSTTWLSCTLKRPATTSCHTSLAMEVLYEAPWLLQWNSMQCEQLLK